MEMVRQWHNAVKLDLVPGLHGHQAKALALLSWGMAASGSCCSGLIAARLPTPARPASTRRRMERMLANQRLDATKAMLGLAGSLLRDWGGRPLLLILDETPKGQQLRCMKLSVAYRKRTVTLLSLCYRPDHPPMPMPRLVRWMLRQVADRLPADAAGQVTLLADRGLCWPTLIRCCRRLRWHYVLRLQAGTRVRLADGTERAARQLVPRPGTRWFGSSVRLFKKARWLAANVAAVWEPGVREPWLLVTDHPASYRRCCRGYCKRTWCEETHRDEKSQGLNWQRSRVNDPSHAQRLVLLMALATLLCITLGVAAIKRGLRRWFEPRQRRMLSLFQLGLRWLDYQMVHDEPLRPLPSLPPP
jgi:hypothetical protein